MHREIWVTQNWETNDYEMYLSLLEPAAYELDDGRDEIPAGAYKLTLMGENGWPEIFFEGEWIDWADPITEYPVFFLDSDGNKVSLK